MATDQLIRELAPSALVIGNNLMAIGVLRALRAQGIQVPEQMAVVAIDDPFWAEIVEPPLTVLAQPVRRMAACVIDLLLERLRGERTESRHVVFQCELIERQSGR